MYFRESHVCANKLDVHETDFSVTQFYRSCKEYISSYRKSQPKWIREFFNIYTNFIMTNEDNNHDTKYIINNDTNNHDARDLHE